MPHSGPRIILEIMQPTASHPRVSRRIAAGWFLSLLAAAPACCQAVPSVAAVVGAAGLSPLPAAVEGYASVFGSHLSDRNYSAGIPYPKTLGPAQVFVCPDASGVTPACDVAELVFVSPGQINFRPHNTGVFGDVFVVVQVAGVPSAPFRARLALFAPAVFMVGWDCPVDGRYQGSAQASCALLPGAGGANSVARGAVTDVSGNILTSARRARLGQSYVVWLTGLGPFPNRALLQPVSIVIPNVPVYGGADRSAVLAPDYAGTSGQYPGLYQVNFTLPPSLAAAAPDGSTSGWPCGDYDWELTLGLFQGANASNTVRIPLHIANGDVPCN